MCHVLSRFMNPFMDMEKVGIEANAVKFDHSSPPPTPEEFEQILRKERATD